MAQFSVVRIAIVLVLGALAQSSFAQGIAVPIGGALKYNNDEVWSRLVQLAGGKGARYAVFATAAANPDKSAASIVDALNNYGANAEHIPVAPNLKTPDYRSAVNDAELIAKVRASTGIYFAGGAQERITRALYQADGKPTPMLEAIWEVFSKGGVVAGSSAGAAIMSTTMIRDAPDKLAVLKFGARKGKEIDRGLGFVGPDVFVDQHFLKRGRYGRALPVMLQTGYKLGIGVEENTAVVIRGDDAEVIGAKGGALIIDLTDTTTDAKQKAFNLRNARLTYLDHGDHYNFKTRTTTPSAEKLKGTRLDPNDKGYSPYFSADEFYPNVLGDNVVLSLMTNFIDNKQKEVIGLVFGPPGRKDAKPDLGFEFRFRKGADSLGYFSSSSGGVDLTVTNIYLDIRPVRMSTPLYRAYQSQRSGAN
jgi:cyanophycinase